MQAHTDSLTRFLAVWGALLSTLGMGWTLYRDLLDRPKLKLSAKVSRITRATDGKFYSVAPHLNEVLASAELFVVMNVVNIGRRPVMAS